MENLLITPYNILNDKCIAGNPYD